MTKCAAVIFDWAGTMVDFGSCAPVIAMRQAFEAERVTVSDAEVRAGMGLAKRDHVVSVFASPRVASAWEAAHGARHSEADIDRIFGDLDGLMRAAGLQRATLIPGALACFQTLMSRGVRVASGTGYTRAMMAPILEAAIQQGYRPELVVCAGEAPQGRPAPYMIWKALSEMQVWPAAAVVKVDDAPVGIAEGKNAGCFTIGVAASGNAMGFDLPDYLALKDDERRARLATARTELLAAGADCVIDTVADLPVALGARGWL